MQTQMNKRIFAIITITLLIFVPIKAAEKASGSHSYLVTNTELPQSVDLKQNINTLSLEELRLLKNYVYAVHGLYFMEADLNAYFNANTKWYEKWVNEHWEDENFPLKAEDVKLTTEESAFVSKIDARMNQLKQKDYVRQGDYNLANVNNVVNLFQFNELDKEFLNKLSVNNFAITPGANVQLFHVYEENDYRQIPNFVTTDLYLQAFHMYFSYMLKSLEKEKFIPALSELCLGFYNQSMQIAGKTTDANMRRLAEYNATFYAIPYYFLSGKNLPIPMKYTQDYKTEIKNINNQSDSFSKFLSYSDVYFPYSLFKPRGHYTRKPEMKAYFKAMMWLQTAPFCREENEQLRQTIYSAVLLNTAKTASGKSLMSLYRSVYEPIVFLIGLPDNLSVMDISSYLKKQNVNDLRTALTPANIDKVNKILVDLSKVRNQIKPQIEKSCSDKINFMPQRYLLDNEVLMKLVDVRPNSKRAYPRGLDVFSALGSAPAKDLLDNFYKEKDNWAKYPEEMAKLQSKFQQTSPNWNGSVYNKWIESLLTLQKSDKSYPCFMQTKAWDLKNLNTSLASWAELKHDAILYGEQPMSAECGDGGPPKPIVVGYVEPNIAFWNKMIELMGLSSKMLEKNNLWTADLKSKAEQFEGYLKFNVQVSQKELANQSLSEEEFNSIEYMGSSIEYFTLSVLDPDLALDNWSLVQGPDKSIAVVADIYTRNVEGCEKDGILHIGTGNVNNIYVVVNTPDDLRRCPALAASRSIARGLDGAGTNSARGWSPIV